MKLKISLIIFILISTAGSTYSQTCGTQFSEEKADSLIAFYNRDDHTNQKKNKIIIPVTLWLSEQYEFKLSNVTIFALINEANQSLSPANIELYSWENTVRRNIKPSAIYGEKDNLNYLYSGAFVEGTLNIYFGDIQQGFSGIMLGHDYNVFNAEATDAIFISPYKLEKEIIAHEVGHYLGLLHTFGVNDFNSRHGRPITDEFVSGSNCQIAGDLLCDTPADPGNNIDGIPNCTYLCSIFPWNNCYKQPGTDLAYMPDTKNIMSYFNSCREHFSPRQLSVMSSYVSTQRNFRIPTSECEWDANEPCYPADPSYALSNTVSTPPLVFQRSVSGKFDNSWDIDSYFMALGGGNRNYKVTVISDIPAVFKIYRRDSPNVFSEHTIMPGTSPQIIINMPGAAHVKLFDIKPSITPDCGSSYTITIENYDENCMDNNEPNNSKLLSTLMGQLSQVGQKLNASGLIEGANDVDFFAFSMNSKGTYQITLESNGADFDFIYDQNGFEFKNHIKNGVGTEFLEVQNTSNSHEIGYIKVQTKGNAYSCDAKYNLKVVFKEVLCNTSCTPDIYEDNNKINSVQNPIFSANDQAKSQVVHANIHTSNDNDYYKVRLSNKGKITIDLTDMPKQYMMYPFSVIGGLIPEMSITNNLTKIEYEKLEDGPFEFFINIETAPSFVIGLPGLPPDPCEVRCENYKLTFTWVPKDVSSGCSDLSYEPNNTPSYASAVFGTLGNESKQTEINPKIGSDGDYDYFKIKLSKNGNLKFNVFSDNYPVRIELSKDGYNFFKSKNSTGSNDPNNSPLTYDFLSGSDETLYLRAYSPGNQFNCNYTYSLLLDWAPVNTIDGGAGNCIDALAEPNDNFSNANDGYFNFNEISQSQNGEFFISSPNDLDYFKITTKYNGLLDVVLNNLSVDLDFEVFDKNFNSIGISKNNFLTAEKITFVSDASSQYYIKIYGKNNQFDCVNKYRLVVNWQREQLCNDFLNNDILSSILLGVLSSDATESMISNHKISRFGERDYFKFTVKNTGTLHLFLRKGDLDYDIYLTDKNQNILAKSTRIYFSDELYYFNTNPNVELYLYIEAKGFKFDCSENYIFNFDWTPQVESPDQNQYPCNSVIVPNIAYDPDGNPYSVWSGNISSGQSNISNYYCGSGSYGKELVFEFYYDPKPGQELDITLWKMKNPGLDFYLLDGCDPTISFCYGKVESEYWSLLGYYRASSRFRDLETNKKYYIFVDGVLDNEEFEIEISIRDPWVIWEDPDTGCGIPRPLFNYQCVGGKYNVIMDLTGVNVKSLTSPTHIITKLSNSVYKINNVSSEDVSFNVKYISNKGFNCSQDFVVPKYFCNINVSNCFGLNPPFIPSKVEVCPENSIPAINVYNPHGYIIEWYNSAQGGIPVFTGNDFIPDSFGIYFIRFSDPLNFCHSDRLPVIVEEVPEISFSESIDHNKCFGDSKGKIEILTESNIPYEIYWSNGQVGSSNENLNAGLYSVTLYDKNQCKVEKLYRIYEPDKLVFVNDSPSDNFIHLCYSDSITMDNSLKGGILPYKLFYKNEEIPEQINLSKSGGYNFIAVDANLCQIERQVEIIKSIEIPIEFILDTFENKIYLTCPVLYTNAGVWSTGDTTATIEINQSGEYTVEIIGDYNCINSKSITVNKLSSDNSIDKPSAILFPNPADDYILIKCNSCNDFESDVEIRSIDGLLCLKSPYQFNQELDISHLNPGIYTVSLNIANFIVHNKLIVLK